MWLKYAHSSVDIGSHRYTNVQNYIRGNISVIKKNAPPPPPVPKTSIQPCNRRRV